MGGGLTVGCWGNGSCFGGSPDVGTSGGGGVPGLGAEAPRAQPASSTRVVKTPALPRVSARGNGVQGRQDEGSQVGTGVL
jgi:hypothetical protein